MKKNITNMLRERVTLLEVNSDNKLAATTVCRFRNIVKARAFIRPINGQEPGVYEIIIPMLSILQSKMFSGIRWADIEYECTTEFKEYGDRYLRGNVKRISDNR